MDDQTSQELRQLADWYHGLKWWQWFGRACMARTIVTKIRYRIPETKE